MLHRLCNISLTQSFFLFGARGTGKTTLLEQQIFASQREQCLLIDLLKLKERDSLQADPDSLESRITAQFKWVIVDEVQRVPNLLDTVHRLIESRKIKFALTGSSARKLKAGGANLLAGRAFVYELFPMTHKELGSQFDLIHTLRWGSLPKIYEFADDKDKQLFLEAYALTYLKEEIWDEHLVKELNPFRRFLQVAAQANGTVLNYSKIAKDTQVDTKTVQNYFQILEDTLLCMMLEPYHKSPRKRLRANPKCYFFDIGVVRALTNDFSLDYGPRSLGFGYRFEHFVITEIMRLNSYFKKRFTFSYIRTKEDLEVDLVIERPGLPLVLVEIKSSANISREHVDSLQRIASQMPDAELICLSLDPHEKRFDRIRALPWERGIEEIGLKE